MAEQVLLIEDEEKIARVLQLELEHENYQVTHAQNGREGLDLALSGTWDLILLDIMLPGLNGLEVLRCIRQSDSSLPVLLLTARDATPDKVSGLDQGANDYVTKPFAIEELLARIRNILRTSRATGNADSTVLRTDDLVMDLKTRKVTRQGNEIELTQKEFDLLQFLLRHKGEVMSREQILSDVWGYAFAGDTNLVDVYIRYLRQKMDKGYSPKLIQTSRGVGYVLRELES